MPLTRSQIISDAEKSALNLSIQIINLTFAVEHAIIFLQEDVKTVCLYECLPHLRMFPYLLADALFSWQTNTHDKRDFMFIELTLLNEILINLSATFNFMCQNELPIFKFDMGVAEIEYAQLKKCNRILNHD